MTDSGEKDYLTNVANELDRIAEAKDESESRESTAWTLGDAAVTAGDFLEDAAEGVAEGAMEKAADLGSAALSGAAQVGGTVVDGAVEAVSAIIGSIFDS